MVNTDRITSRFDCKLLACGVLSSSSSSCQGRRKWMTTVFCVNRQGYDTVMMMLAYKVVVIHFIGIG